MTEEEQILTLLQHGDSFFPSGAVSFSWGLEMLKDDNLVTSIETVESFIKNQLHERWAPFERAVLVHTYDSANDMDSVIAIDDLVECMTLASELRDGSKRLGSALLTTYSKLNNICAVEYQQLVHQQSAHGHLPIAQAIIWKSIGISKSSVLALSAYNFCVAILGAAVRMGLVGHIDCQHSLTNMREIISQILTRPVPDLENLHAFTPYADIAAMRHEQASTRLFAN